MFVAEGRRVRRIVGRLERGVELVAALRKVCSDRHVRAGEIRLLGALEVLEIATIDVKAHAYRPARRFVSTLEIVGFVGHVAEKGGALDLQGQISVSRESDNGVEVLGGHLISAQVLACEFVIEAWDDLLLRRAVDSATGLVVWHEAFEEAPPPSPPPSPASASPPASVSSPPPDPLPVVPDLGDVIRHPTFGRAQVEKIEGEGEFAAVRLASGRLIRLSLDVLNLRLDGSEAGRRVFQANVRR